MSKDVCRSEQCAAAEDTRSRCVRVSTPTEYGDAMFLSIPTVNTQGQLSAAVRGRTLFLLPSNGGASTCTNNTL